MAEILRDIHDELNLAACQEASPFLLGAYQPDKIKIGAVFQALQESSRFRSVIRQKDRGRKMARIRIDDISEQKHLKNRQPKHDRKSHAVPTHLNEFLDDHSEKPPWRKETFHDE